MNDKTQRFEDWFGDYLKKVKGPVSADAAYLLRDELPKAWHARDSELATLRSQLLQAQGEAAAMRVLIQDLGRIEDFGDAWYREFEKALSGQACKELLEKLETLRKEDSTARMLLADIKDRVQADEDFGADEIVELISKHIGNLSHGPSWLVRKDYEEQIRLLKEELEALQKQVREGKA